MKVVRVVFACVVLSACLAAPVSGQVTRLEVLSRTPMAQGPTPGAAGPYELIAGRVHGEIDPADRRNAIIQDLGLAPRNDRGRVEYVATFSLAKPIDPAKASGVLIYSVVNRGNGAPQASPDGHVWLVSGWQGDLPPAPDKQTIAVPVARNADGTPITGRMVARFANAAAGTTTMPIRHTQIGNPPPAYPPVDLVQPEARLVSIGSETMAGVQRDVREIPRGEWAFADCRIVPFPGTPDATQLCIKGGFDPARLYQLAYTVRDPLVLGVGLAATRDITAFFRDATADAAGTPNPVAGAVRHVVAIGDSQSGNFIRTFIHLGFNEGADGRAVWDGAFPRIAARQTPINLRFGVPGGAASLFEAGSEPTIWWGAYEDRTRGRRRASLLDRCTATKTCPKIVEAFGAAEFWGLRMSPDLVGTDARQDIPLPATVRRYYYPGTTHGGGRGGFAIDAAAPPAGCSLPANPNPQADTTRALTQALVEWVVRDVAPPESRYPRLARGELVSPDAVAAAFARIPGARDPRPLLNPLLDYDFGPGLIAADLGGVLHDVPPRVRRVLPMLVPRVGADGNELDGLPSVLHQAPLGTYVGWNAFAAGFFKDQGCGFSGGYLPFARTRAERLAARDPRPSLEERYRTHDGYVGVVRAAAEAAVTQRVLLRADADRLIAEAQASDVLRATTAKVAGTGVTPEACDSATIAARLAATATVQSADRRPDRTCVVKATTSSGPGSVITFEVWVPEGWNGKLVATGNGGFSNAINAGDMAYALSQGYAAVGGDTGHQGPTPDDLRWGVGAPERILDWGTRSIHTILGPARRIVEAVGGRAPRRTYFYGCSTGGHQAFALLQRYPRDVDGVIAGAPGHNRVRLTAAFLWRFLATHRSGDAEPILPAAKLPMITRAVVAACDANDGVTDGVVDDPRTCRFDPSVLACRGGDDPACLTAPQLGSLRRLYDGLRSVTRGTTIYSGWPMSSEALTTTADGRPAIGWHQYWGGAEPARAAFWREWVFRDPAWDWWQFEPDRDLPLADAAVGGAIDQTSANLRVFASHGGKAIVYHGWQDPVVNPLDTIAYYEQVRTELGPASRIDGFFRLFLVPGMGHCAGGPGTTCFGNPQSPAPVVDAAHDLLSALDAWVERGRAPDRLIASRVVDGRTVRTRPLCPYPRQAVHLGRGSTDDAASFACR